MLRLTRLFFSFAILGLFISSVQAQDAKPIAWKFEKDKSFFQEMYTKTVQTMKVMGQDVSQVQEQTFYFKWTPIKQEGDKWTLKQTIEGVKMKIDVAGNPISFDSTSTNAPGAPNNALNDFFKALIGSEFTLTLDTKTNKVEKIEGRDAFLTKLNSANQQMEPLLKKILSEDALKQMADPAFGMIPNGPKKKDETWESVSNLNLGPIGQYENKYKYKLVEPGDKAKIEVETTLTYKAPTGEETGLPFKIKSADLKTKDKQTPGTIVFDTVAGRLVSSESKLKLSGTLTIEIGTTSTTVELLQEQDTTVKTSDTSYIKK